MGTDDASVTRTLADGRLTLELVRGDIVKQPGIDAVVNAANAELAPGGGVAGAIHRAAGPALYEECRDLAPIEVGQAVLTDGHDLPNPHVVHVLGPRYGIDEPSDELLAAGYRNALTLADDYGLESIAFPSLSTGAFGYPLEEAAEVALRSVAEAADGLGHLRRVRFVLWGEEAFKAFQAALDAVEDGG